MKYIIKLICLMMAVSIMLFSVSACSDGSGNLAEPSQISNEKNATSNSDNESESKVQAGSDAVDTQSDSSVVATEADAKSDAVNQNNFDESMSSAALSDGDVSSEKPASIYEEIVSANFSSFPGTYSYAFHNYGSGETLQVYGSKQKSASIIKLFIMEYAYDLMQKGELKSDSVVGGRSVSSLIEAMITLSDNNATNTLIDYFTMEKINAFITSCGYTDTVLGRKMLDTAAAARGEENYTSVGDVMKFLDKLYTNRETYPYNEMLSVMKRQQIATKIRRDIPSGVEIASKTGELSDTDNDAGIIFTSNGDFAFVCFTQNASPEPARDCIAKSARALYDEITKKE